MRVLHEYSGFVFTPVLILLALIWLKNSLPKVYDMNWLIHAGGYLGYKGGLKSGKFNAGQKIWYWVMTIPSILLIWTGLALFFQYGDLPDFRLYVVIHFYAAIPIMLMFVVHLYMTTLGTKGAFNAMIHGKFSKSAAQKYHSEAAELK